MSVKEVSKICVYSCWTDKSMFARNISVVKESEKKGRVGAH